MEVGRLRTELPFPTRPWEAARERFLEGLSDEDKQTFKEASPNNIFYTASAAFQRHASGSRSWVMQQKATSLVEAISDYGKALDVYANASSLILCPLWGSIRVLIHVGQFHLVKGILVCQDRLLRYLLEPRTMLPILTSLSPTSMLMKRSLHEKPANSKKGWWRCLRLSGTPCLNSRYTKPSFITTSAFFEPFLTPIWKLFNSVSMRSDSSSTHGEG